MYPNRRAQKSVESTDIKLKSANAVKSAGSGATQLFAYAVIDGVQIREALADSGSSFSMLSSTLYARLPSKPAIHLFKNSAPDIVGVGGASAKVRGYVDVPLQIVGVEIAHPLLVVQNLAFPLLIGADILRPHAAAMLF